MIIKIINDFKSLILFELVLFGIFRFGLRLLIVFSLFCSFLRGWAGLIFVNKNELS